MDQIKLLQNKLAFLVNVKERKLCDKEVVQVSQQLDVLILQQLRSMNYTRHESCFNKQPVRV